MRRGARARSTKQKARIQRYEELRDRPGATEDSRLELSSISARLGKTTVELEHICKGYGDRKLIDDFSYIFLKGDRVGICRTEWLWEIYLVKDNCRDDPVRFRSGDHWTDG